MRRWLGQISGGEKRNEAGEEDIDRETKKRKFNAKWLTGREWLVFDHENVVMFCQDCRIYAKEKNKTSNFVVGTNNLSKLRQ